MQILLIYTPLHWPEFCLKFATVQIVFIWFRMLHVAIKENKFSDGPWLVIWGPCIIPILLRESFPLILYLFKISNHFHWVENAIDVAKDNNYLDKSAMSNVWKSCNYSHEEPLSLRFFFQCKKINLFLKIFLTGFNISQIASKESMHAYCNFFAYLLGIILTIFYLKQGSINNVLLLRVSFPNIYSNSNHFPWGAPPPAEDTTAADTKEMWFSESWRVSDLN